MNNKCFIFDHDGVIADTENLHEKVWVNFFESHKIEMNKDIYRLKVRGRSTLDVIKLFFQNISDEKIDILCKEKASAYKIIFEKKLKPIEGIVDFIKRTKEQNIKIAVASSAKKERVMFTLNRFKIKDLVDVIITAEDVIMSKPNPEIYNSAMSAVGVKPEDTIIFEDSESGLEAANLSGAKAVFINSSRLDKNTVLQEYIIDLPNFLNILPEEILKWI